MSQRHTFRISAKLENLPRIHQFLEEAAERLDLEPSVVYDVRLAVEEAVANTVLHGYQGQEGDVEIIVARVERDLLVYLRDSAPPFDATLVPSPDLSGSLEDRSVGGLGIHLIRQVVDELIYSLSPDGKNELILVKKEVGRRSTDGAGSTA